MSWGGAYTTPAANSRISCPDVNLGIVDNLGKPELCLSKSRVWLTLENNGESKITGIKIVQLGGKDAFSEEMSLSIQPGEFKPIDFGQKTASLTKLRLIPLAEKELCVDKRIELENMPPCLEEKQNEP
jgi:hypothetical protein